MKIFVLLTIMLFAVAEETAITNSRSAGRKLASPANQIFRGINCDIAISGALSTCITNGSATFKTLPSCCSAPTLTAKPNCTLIEPFNPPGFSCTSGNAGCCRGDLSTRQCYNSPNLIGYGCGIGFLEACCRNGQGCFIAADLLLTNCPLGYTYSCCELP